MIFSNGSIFALDVSVTKEASPKEQQSGKDRLQYQYREKIRTYEEYQKYHPNEIIVPFVMNVYGIYHRSTVDFLDQICRKMRVDTNFRKDVLRHTQCCLQKAIYSSFSRLKAKKIVSEHKSQIFFPPPPSICPTPPPT